MPIALELPFLYFARRPVDPAQGHELERAFLWFERPLTLGERKRVAAGCPTPLRSGSVWGDRFARFASTHDGLESAITSAYGSEGRSALALYCDDVERWVLEAHEVAPLVFVLAPGRGGTESERHRSSLPRAERALRAVCDLASASPWLDDAEGLDLLDPALAEAPIEPVADDDEGPDVSPELVAPSLRWEVVRAFREIHDLVLDTVLAGADEPTRAEAVEWLFARERATRGVESSTSIERSAERLSEWLGHVSASEAIVKIARFSPWTQLAFVASGAATQRGVLLAHEDAAGWIRTLVASVPPEREAAVVPVLVQLGRALIACGEHYDDPTRTRLAGEVSALVASRSGLESDFAKSASYFAAAGAYDRALAIARQALERHPDSRSLAADARRYLARLRGLPLPRELLQECDALCAAGELEEARDLVDHYLAQDGETPAEVLDMLAALLHLAPPDALPDALDRLERRIRDDLRVLVDEPLVEHAFGLLRENGRAVRAVRLALDAIDAGVPCSPMLAWQLASSADVAGDPELDRAVLAELHHLLGWDAERFDGQPGLFGNLAVLHARRGEVDEAFACLTRLLTLAADVRDEVVGDEALRPLHADPRWVASICCWDPRRAAQEAEHAERAALLHRPEDLARVEEGWFRIHRAYVPCHEALVFAGYVEHALPEDARAALARVCAEAEVTCERLAEPVTRLRGRALALRTEESGAGAVEAALELLAEALQAAYRRRSDAVVLGAVARIRATRFWAFRLVYLRVDAWSRRLEALRRKDPVLAQMLLDGRSTAEALARGAALAPSAFDDVRTVEELLGILERGDAPTRAYLETRGLPAEGGGGWIRLGPKAIERATLLRAVSGRATKADARVLAGPLDPTGPE